MASPEPEQPREKRENEPDRYADEQLVRQDAGKSRGDENGAGYDRHDDAEERTKNPVGKKRAEQYERRRAARASTQGQRQDRREQHTCVLLGRTHRTDLSHKPSEAYYRRRRRGQWALEINSDNAATLKASLIPCARRFGQSRASTKSNCANLSQCQRAGLSISAPFLRTWPPCPAAKFNKNANSFPPEVHVNMH